jgi:hypothetical protein
VRGLTVSHVVGGMMTAAAVVPGRAVDETITMAREWTGEMMDWSLGKGGGRSGCVTGQQHCEKKRFAKGYSPSRRKKRRGNGRGRTANIQKGANAAPRFEKANMHPPLWRANVCAVSAVCHSHPPSVTSCKTKVESWMFLEGNNAIHTTQRPVPSPWLMYPKDRTE